MNVIRYASLERHKPQLWLHFKSIDGVGRLWTVHATFIAQCINFARFRVKHRRYAPIVPSSRSVRSQHVYRATHQSSDDDRPVRDLKLSVELCERES